MTKVLLDLNVLLDVILDRKPGVRAAARLWAVLEQGSGQGFIPGHGVTTVFSILEKARGAAVARRAVEQLLHVSAVAPITDVVLRRALVFAWPDFEDAVCAASAEAAGCDFIVSRDPAGFPDAPIPVIDAAAALGLPRSRAEPCPGSALPSRRLCQPECRELARESPECPWR